MTYDIIKSKVNMLMNDRAYAGKRYFDLCMMVLIIISVTLLVMELTHDGEGVWENIYGLDDVILAIFIMEYVSRLWVCSHIRKGFKKAYRTTHRSWLIKVLSGLYAVVRDKLKFMTLPMSIIDLLAILPMFRVFRAFRIFRLLRLFKVIRYSHSMENLFMIFRENASEMGLILAFIGLIIIISSTFIFILEKNAASGYFQTMGDAVWWSFVTITTVGYGDKVPTTDLGRVLAVFLMLAAIVSIALPSGVLASAMTQKFIAIREGKLSMKKFKNHIVICGWNNSAEQLMKELHKNTEKEKWDIVAVTLKPMSEVDAPNVIVKQGDFTKEPVLNDVNVKDAQYVIVVSEELRGISDESIDARSFLVCNLIYNINPDVYMIAQLLNTENEKILKKTVPHIETIISDDITGGLLSSSIVSPGTSRLVNNLISHNQDNIIKVPLNKLKGTFNSFKDLLAYCRQPAYNWLPLAVEKDGELFVNPKDDFPLQGEEFMFCIETEIDV